VVRYVTISSIPRRLTFEQENAPRASQSINDGKPFATVHAYKRYSVFRSERTPKAKTLNSIRFPLFQQATLAVQYVLYSL